jgi:hypothetical protein
MLVSGVLRANSFGFPDGAKEVIKVRPVQVIKHNFRNIETETFHPPAIKRQLAEQSRSSLTLHQSQGLERYCHHNYSLGIDSQRHCYRLLHLTKQASSLAASPSHLLIIFVACSCRIPHSIFSTKKATIY